MLENVVCPSCDGRKEFTIGGLSVGYQFHERSNGLPDLCPECNGGGFVIINFLDSHFLSHSMDKARRLYQDGDYSWAAFRVGVMWADIEKEIQQNRYHMEPKPSEIMRWIEQVVLECQRAIKVKSRIECAVLDTET